MARNRETKLEVVQGEDLRLRFRYKIDGVAQDLSTYTIKCQIREKPGGPLILDMAQYLIVNPDDSTAVDLYVPGVVTQTVKKDGVWDLFIGATRLVHGPVDLTRSVSQ